MKLLMMTLFGIMTFIPAVSASEGMCNKLDNGGRNARNVECVSISDDAARAKCEAKHVTVSSSTDAQVTK